MTKSNRTAAWRYKRNGQFLLAGLIFAMSQSVFAITQPESVNFSHKDWDLVCDNTLTCRAAGYSTDDIQAAATVLITREAGPSTLVTNRVMLADYDGEAANKTPGKPMLLIDGHSQGKLLTVDGDAWQMSDAQFTAFKQALRRDSKISFKDNINEYFFSGAGSSAVLLKMDDVQGRVGTSGALMKKGNNDESGVRMPIPEPVIVKAPVRDKESRDMTPQEMALIKPTLLGIVSKSSDCDEERVNSTWQIAGLNETQSLVMVPCWMAAYNSGDIYFVISNDLSSPPEMVTDNANGYFEGTVSFFMKGRGLGDCLNLEEWTWNGEHFAQSSAKNTGRCRLIRAGGAWDLPTLKTNVVTR